MEWKKRLKLDAQNILVGTKLSPSALSAQYLEYGDELS